MPILIENELIYLAIPKTGCISITNAIIRSNLNYKLAPVLKKQYEEHKEEMNDKDSKYVLKTIHYRLDQLKSEFGNKKTIAIKRNHLDRFVSAINYSYLIFERENIIPKISLDEIDNEYIYNLIDDKFVLSIENQRFIEVIKYFTDDVSKIKKDSYLGFLYAFASSSFMKGGYKVDYEFDISELHLLENFLNDRYGSNVKIEKLNYSEKFANNLIKNTELSDFIWDKFEKKYHEKKLL